MAVYDRFTGKKGSCDLFSPSVLPFPSGVRQGEASSFLSVSPAAGGLYGQKHNLPITKQKRRLCRLGENGVIAPDLGVFFVYRTGVSQTGNALNYYIWG